MQKNKLGTLYVVATPIGNLKDISFRAIETLKEVAEIAVEDTRHASQLLNHFGIKKPLISLHNFNEKEKIDSILAKLKEETPIALISDAGTPLISDPGFNLVRACREAGINVIPIPGPCAAITALCAAGLPSDQFVFVGFLPAKSHAKQAALENFLPDVRTHIFYEAPHRLLQTLHDMAAVFGETRKVVVAKELTKIFENFFEDTIPNLIQYFDAHPDVVRGEMVILLEGNKQANASPPEMSEKLLKAMLPIMPLKQAVKIIAEITEESKNEIYEKALLIKKSQET